MPSLTTGSHTFRIKVDSQTALSLEEESKQIEEGPSGLSSESEYDAYNEKAFDGTELVTGLLFGGEGCGHDRQTRESIGINHVLSIITTFEQGFKPDQEMICSGHWKIFRIEDSPTADLLHILDDAVEFINQALRSPHGKIVVHSLEGRSRCVAVCIAYLMKTLGMTLKSAVGLVEANQPEVRMNRGFWRQMLAYESSIRGCSSMMEEECPGAVIFEREEIQDIIDKYLDSIRGPLSPTAVIGLANLGIGTTRDKRKSFDWSSSSPKPGRKHSKSQDI